ncbi:asparaginyl-tRNA synthetase/beta-aspartyl-peptidase (threonine type) [Actinokineospora alba]|uniref:Asparaginyl-tRNA synthetase/beta-aspartyl-peptidase (Threonine type) n=1 Tax=Actinokineospora alba TaxID=504798 RepID=A0A1H0HEZ8_9PSEU|nr:asparagine synthetase A [Actinokineospora alba]TDP64915.1 asparaginyl-tRNA synthetase [Actinokineospora alba]SDH49283.1 asparaginyl-tRNA synthetase/beta-aspartyl-peptidase (threonine type) [Actinokineospora alba]SDO17624.1 asparaginyl-tRNA synthetase/beta-aspartyl-peptidase (threonine type) [Actinokineospora alba]
MTTVLPPRVWDNPEKHFVSALSSPWYRTVTTVNSVLVKATNDFYAGRDIIPVLMPITVSSVSSPMGLGSDSLPVDIELFGERTFLADSMQFQLEFMLRHDVPGAYYIMPTFRGEDPDSTHLNQFFHSEAEIVGGYEDVLRLVEDYLRGLCGALLASAPATAALGSVTESLAHLEAMAADARFPRLTFAEAVKVLGGRHVVEKAPGAPAITRAGEQELIAHAGGPVWLTHPPHLSVPFYQAVDDSGAALSADLLMGIGEVVGSGERHGTRAQAEAALATHGVRPEEYEWYLQMKEDTPMTTAGFGLGLERFLLWVFQHDDIRDLHVMPRLKGTATWV